MDTDFVKLIIYELSYKKSKSISIIYFHSISKHGEQAKIHVMHKFEITAISVASFI